MADYGHDAGDFDYKALARREPWAVEAWEKRVAESQKRPVVLPFKTKEERELDSLRKEVESLSENLTLLMQDVGELAAMLGRANVQRDK